MIRDPEGERGGTNTGIAVFMGSVSGVLLVGIIVVAMFVSGGAFADDTDDARVVGWQVKRPGSAGDTAAAFPTKSGETIVRVGTTDVSGYEIESGDRQWQVDVPDGMEVCASANSAPDDIAAVVVGDDGSCTDILGVDVKKGKLAWRDELKGPESKTAAVSTFDKRVFVSTKGGISRFDAERGPDAEGDDKEPLAVGAPKGCEMGYSLRAGSKAAFGVMKCQTPPTRANPQPGSAAYVTGFDAKSLRIILRSELGTGDDATDKVEVVSAAPIIVRDIANEKDGELRFFDSRGKESTKLSAKQDDGTLDLNNRKQVGLDDTDANHEYVFQQAGSYFVMPLVRSGDERAEVSAVDLKKREVAWTKTVGRADGGGSVELSAADDDPDSVTAIDAGSDGKIPQIVTVKATKKGEVSRGDLLPESASQPGKALYFSLGPAFLTMRTESGDLVTAYGA